MVILDTDHISLLERTSSPQRERLDAHLETAGIAVPVVTIVSYEEQTRGWMTYLAAARSMAEQVMAYDRLMQQLKNYCAWKVLPYDDRAAAKFQELRKQKLRVGTMDLKIAAIALVQGGLLLSRNLSDFGRVPGLRVDDWTK
jgi:tRNA(fMet)-specific endonuclease VapC